MLSGSEWIQCMIGGNEWIQCIMTEGGGLNVVS